MSIVRINAITVPEGGGSELQNRFEKRVGGVESMEGFEGFELLAPAEGNTWYVYTRWASVQAFEAWVNSETFRHGHAKSAERPVGTGSELLAFDVVLEAGPKA